jgi:hypothetical protein
MCAATEGFARASQHQSAHSLTAAPSEMNDQKL